MVLGVMRDLVASERRIMGLTIRALKVGTLVGLPKPSFTYMRGWTETFDSTLFMFLIEGGESPILVDTGPSTIEATWDLHKFRMVQEESERPLEALRLALRCVVGRDQFPARLDYL